MRKYWYTILLTISLSGAAAARMIPDSVAEAVAAEIIDLGTDIPAEAETSAADTLPADGSVSAPETNASAADGSGSSPAVT